MKTEEIEEIYKIEKHAKVKQRLQAIILAKKGYEKKEIANIIGLSRTNVFRWINRFKEEGIEGLKDKQRSGRPQKIKKEKKEKLKDDLKSSPKNFGYKEDTWTTKLILFHLKNNYNVSYHEGYIQRFLRSIGFELKKPRPKNYKRNEEEVKQYKQLMWEYLKKHRNHIHR